MKLIKLRSLVKDALCNVEMKNTGISKEAVEETRSYRETWIIPNLKNALEMIEAEIAKKKKAVQLNALEKCPKCGKEPEWDVSDPHESVQFCSCGWRNTFGLEV